MRALSRIKPLKKKIIQQKIDKSQEHLEVTANFKWNIFNRLVREESQKICFLWKTVFSKSAFVVGKNVSKFFCFSRHQKRKFVEGKLKNCIYIWNNFFPKLQNQWCIVASWTKMASTGLRTPAQLGVGWGGVDQTCKAPDRPFALQSTQAHTLWRKAGSARWKRCVSPQFSAPARGLPGQPKNLHFTTVSDEVMRKSIGQVKCWSVTTVLSVWHARGGEGVLKSAGVVRAGKIYIALFPTDFGLEVFLCNLFFALFFNLWRAMSFKFDFLPSAERWPIFDDSL